MNEYYDSYTGFGICLLIALMVDSKYGYDLLDAICFTVMKG